MGYRYTTQYMTDNADIMFDDVRTDSIVIAPFWDDLKILANSSIVIAQNTQYYVIKYQGMGFGNNTTIGDDVVTFQVIIPKSHSVGLPTTTKYDFLGQALPYNQGVIYFYYQDLIGKGLGGGASIGIQNASVKQKHVFSYDRATLADDTLITCSFGMNTSPAKEDSDFDGLNDFDEFTIGTNPFQPDTDGDGLNDGWEWEFRDDGFDPLINNNGDPKKDKDADFEGDGLTNQEEANWGTDPNNADSDGDGVPDKDEIEQASDPDDPDDDGLPASRIPLSVYFGDDSGSDSEKYVIMIKPVEGNGKSFSWVNAAYGKCETKTALLIKDMKYKLTFDHASTEETKTLDLDYTIEIQTNGIGLVIEDPSKLLGVHGDDRYMSFKTKAVTIHTLDLTMSADYNRDGIIDDADYSQALRGKPLRWWVNSDRDRDIENGVNGGSDTHLRRFSDGRLNCNDWKVSGKCDLEDFTPIRIKIGSVVKDLLLQNEKYYFAFAQEDRSLNCLWYYGDIDAKTITDFYTATESASMKRFGEEGTSHAWSAHGVHGIWPDRVPNRGLSFPEALMDRIKEPACDEILVFVEGKNSATSPLQLQLRRSKFGIDENIAEVKLPLLIAPIQEMYATLNIRDSSPQLRIGESLACPSATKTLFFVHGYSVSEDGSEDWFSTMFKRFHISGANINFCGVTWHGNDQGTIPNYYNNVKNAFTAAERLDTFLKGLDGNNKTALPTPHSFMAHSLGNMVISSMIQDHYSTPKGQTPSIKSYFMMNAAVPSEAYSDATLAIRDAAPSGLIHDDWKAQIKDGVNVPAYPARAWSANFASLFVSTPEYPVTNTRLNEAKRSLTWHGRFKDVTDTAGLSVFNYYSKGEGEESGDEVFQLMNGTPGWRDGMYLFNNKGSFSWQKQECYKGRSDRFAAIAASEEMGWGFHDKENTSATALAMATPLLRAHPFFVRKPTIIISQIDSTAAVDAIKGQRTHLLAYGIPAISEAAGRVVLTQLKEGANTDLQLRNNALNGNILFARTNRFKHRWLHSDIREVAYSFNANMFKQIINQGDLDE